MVVKVGSTKLLGQRNLVVRALQILINKKDEYVQLDDKELLGVKVG